MRPFALLFAMMFLSCEEPKPSPRTYTVSSSALVRIYRDKAGDHIYTGKRVRLYFPERGYKVVGSELHWFINPDTAVALVVVTDKPPPNNLAALVVEGTCQGIVRDGKERAFGVDYMVLIGNASITIQSP